MIKTMEFVNDSISCLICLERLHRPRILPCSHAFCLLCLQNLVNSNNKKQNYIRKHLICPACRSAAEVPLEEGVAGLCRSIPLENTLHLLKLQEEKGSLDEVQPYSEAPCILCGVMVDPAHLAYRYPKMPICPDCGPRFLQYINKLKIRKDILCRELRESRNITRNEDREAYEDLKNITSLTSTLTQKHQPTLDTNQAICCKENNGVLNRNEGEAKPQLLQDEGNRYRLKRSYSKYRWNRKICRRPAGIAISPWSDNIYVAGSDTSKVYIFDLQGKLVDTIGQRGQGEGQLLCPVGIAFSKITTELFIADKWKHCIYVFNAEGSYLRQIGKKGKGLAEFSSPGDLATDAQGNLYIADTCNDRIQVLDSEGAFLREIGSVKRETFGPVHQYTRREFKEPNGVSATADGSVVYVADSGNHRVKVFDGATGKRLFSIGSRGDNQSQFENPECIAADEAGFFLVGDSGNGRVQVFARDGTFVR